MALSDAESWKKHGVFWTRLVPAQGQADSVQGELIRITGKLTDQAYRNGNVNWDLNHEKMWRFVGRTLDDATFPPDIRTAIRETIETIVRDHATPDLRRTGSTYYFITARTVEWCEAHPVPIPHRHDSTLNR